MGKAIKSVGKIVGKAFNSSLDTASGGIYSKVTGASSYLNDASQKLFGTDYANVVAAAATITAGTLIGGPVGGIAAASAVGYNVMQTEQNVKTKEAAARAKADAEEADREREILRKQALLASQKSMTARKAAAGAVSNKLKNTFQSVLGDEEEKLGG